MERQQWQADALEDGAMFKRNKQTNDGIVIFAPVDIFFARMLDRTGKGLRTGARDAVLTARISTGNTGPGSLVSIVHSIQPAR